EPLTDWNSVLVSPGHSAVTTIPAERSSSCSDSLKAVTTAFVAAYTARFGPGWNPATELVLSTQPRLRAAIGSTAARVSATTAEMLRRISASSSSGANAVNALA